MKSWENEIFPTPSTRLLSNNKVFIAANNERLKRGKLGATAITPVGFTWSQIENIVPYERAKWD